MRHPLSVAAALLVLASALPAQVEVDDNLPDYKPVQGVSGSIKSVGSDTMNNLMTLWAEGFLAVYPNVQVEVEGKGSQTAPAALVAGTANFGPMSRTMKNEEIDSFEKEYGYKPFELNTGIDMLAVYVNKDNPIQSLTLSQVDAMFSKGRKGGHDKDLRSWGDVGLRDAWERQPISLYGRNSASGTYGFFKERALFKGDFKDAVKEQPGSSAVVQGVATDKFGVGYSGIGYKTADVKALPLALDARSEAVPPDAEHAYTGEYPLARFLKVYINKEPNRDLDPLRREFIKYIFSKQGQLDVVKSGYYPVPAEIASEALTSLGIETSSGTR